LLYTISIILWLLKDLIFFDIAQMILSLITAKMLLVIPFHLITFNCNISTILISFLWFSKSEEFNLIAVPVI